MTTKFGQIDQAFIDSNKELEDETYYLIMENLKMSNPFPIPTGRAIAASIIDGNNNTITVLSDNWPGLFNAYTTVKRLGIKSAGNISDGAGWFFAERVNGIAENCYSTGLIGRSADYGTWAGGGGIFGANAYGTAIQCYSTGSIGYNAGGIFGYKSGGYAQNCYSTGSIGANAGGIFGSYLTSIGTAENCYSTGSIGADAGGIFGVNDYYCTAKNCYSIGPVSGRGGGIFGYNASSTAINCYSRTSIFGGKEDNRTHVETNCNVTVGVWADYVASRTLTGIPVNQFPGTIWKSYRPNSPYVLVANPQPPSTNTSLSVVSINGIIANKSGNTYSITLDSYRASAIVNIKTTNEWTTVSFNGKSAYDNISETLLLNFDENSSSIVVTAQDGQTTAIYQLKINNIPFSRSKLLSSVSINGSLIPNINGTYNVYNSPNIASINITPMDRNATIQIANLSGNGNLQGQLNITNRVNVLIIIITLDAKQYAHTLTIRKPIIDQPFINGRIPLLDNTDYLIGENLTITTYLTMTSPFTFDGSGTGITVDGSGYIITALDGSIGQFRAPDEWLGLFSKAITVKNVGIESSMNLTYGAGWFFQEGVSGIAINCYTAGAIRFASGGIFGKAVTGGSATNCYSTGPNESGGGIFGSNSVSCTATNCYSTGVIGGSGGGIFGLYASRGTALKCYSTGSIGLGYAGQMSGGIFGTSAENCSTIKCYSTGNIGPQCGGIVSSGSFHNITACYSLGTLVGVDSGSITATGIFGRAQGSSITNCYGAFPFVSALIDQSTTLSDFYVIQGGVWRDNFASVSLKGVSTIWYSAKPNTPYLLVENPEKFTLKISSVIIDGNTLSEPYRYSIPSLGVSSVSLQITTADFRADIAIAGTGLSGLGKISGDLSMPITGSNQYTINVTATDGRVATYPLQITVPSLPAPSVTVSDPPFQESVGLSWTSPAGGVSYNVYQSPNNITYTKIISNISVLSTTIRNRINGYLYFKVSAVDGNNREGLLSDASIPVLILWAPDAPTNLVSTKSTTPGTVILKWKSPADTGNTDITSFTVFIRYRNIVVFGANIPVNGDGAGGGIITSGGGGGAIIDCSASLTGFSDSIVHTFQVTATNSIGESLMSSSSQIILSSLSSSISSTTNFTDALTPLLTNAPTAILNARAAINNAVKDGTLTNQQYQDLTVAAMNAINKTGGTFASVTSNTSAILATMKTVNTTSPPDTRKPVVVVFPSFSTAPPHVANIDLNTETAIVNNRTLSYANIISTAYLVFELPVRTPGSEYYLTLKNGPDSLTLQYDGTVLRDLNFNKYTANDVLRIGSVTIPLIGLGSIGSAPLLESVVVDATNLTETPFVYSTTKSSVPVSITPENGAASITITDNTGTILLSITEGTLTGVLTLSEGPNSFTINVTVPDNGPVSYLLTITYSGNVPCFPAGTRILTVSGYKKVEDLVTGELVLTADGLRVPAKIYESDPFVATTATAPYRIPKGTFGPAAPANDLLLSPTHFFQIRKGLWMLPKHAALFSKKVTQVMVGAPITYYHIECPQYLRDNLVVEGTVVESFGANQLTAKPYTYNARLKGYTRIGYSTAKNITTA